MNLAQFEHTDDGLAWVFAHPLALLVIIAVLWWLSLHAWPEKVCKRCEGSGFKQGLIGVRRCGRCDGAGLVRRFGSRRDE